MIYKENGEWKFCGYKVKYKQGDTEKEQWALPSKEWWEKTCNKHNKLELIGFEEVELTQEQQERFEEIQDLRLGEGHRQSLIDYVLEGDFPEGNHPLKNFETERRITALERGAGVGQLGQRGVAQRIDKLEDEIEYIKKQLES